MLECSDRSTRFKGVLKGWCAYEKHKNMNNNCIIIILEFFQMHIKDYLACTRFTITFKHAFKLDFFYQF